MKRILSLVAVGLLGATAASAATVPSALKSKVANDATLAEVRGGKPGLPPIVLGNKLYVTPVAVPIQNGSAVLLLGWVYVNTPEITISSSGINVTKPAAYVTIKDVGILK